MYVLGLNLLHDTSAAIVKDGKVLAAVEEERFNRVRHTTAFPRKAINFCLQQANITMDQVDHLVSSFDFSRFKGNQDPFEHNTIAHDDSTGRGKKRILRDNNILFQQMKRRFEREGLQKMSSLPHHISHAAGAYFMSGFKDSNILVIDGRGEDSATTLMKGENGEITEMEKYPIKDSLCHMYTYATHLCGLYANIGLEGKTMGLSAYGNPSIDFSRILTFKEGRYQIDRDRLRELSKYHQELGNINQVSKDIACSVQKAFENAGVFLAKKSAKLTGYDNLALSGGGALNCEMNRALISQDRISRIYVQPAANDAGTAIGAALYKYSTLKSLRPTKQEDVYLGPGYTSAQIEAAIEEAKIRSEKLSDVTKFAADMLSEGKIIGWFQGKMEFGPRALGNRSILANPAEKDIKDKINRFVKHRESWRPFAPSILYERMDDYFGQTFPAPHMTISFKTIKEKIPDLQAAVHVDGTARIQTVHKETNKTYHTLIKGFEDITGIPALLNTSFNNHGRPIVCTPQEAIGCFFSCGMDVLFMGDHMITKT